MGSWHTMARGCGVRSRAARAQGARERGGIWRQRFAVSKQVFTDLEACFLRYTLIQQALLASPAGCGARVAR